MDLQSLRKKIASKEIDNVLVVFPDVLGRLVGKRFTGKFFAESIAEGGTHSCNYLLTVNMEMDPMDGFKLASWEKGYGDFELRCDLSTLRILPWQTATALVLCDTHHHDGTAVAEAPRTLLRKQIDLLAKDGLICNIASELEFYLFNTTYHDAFTSEYRNLKPASDYRIDYHTMQPAQEETLFRAVRNGMLEARIPVESSKGEWGCGQHEINFVYDRPLEMADMHVVFKQGVKEIAAQQGRSITFMPKYSAKDAGNSCHIHTSIWRGDKNLFWDSRAKGPSKMFRQFLGGLMKYAPELCLFFAPTINAYKRYQAGSWAPTKMAWAYDNRTAGFRVVGHGKSFRIENRMPGADANPYLAFTATLLAGMAGVRENLDCGDVYVGNAYIDEKLPALPHSLHQAAELLAGSKLAKEGLGAEVVEFYVHTARLEAFAFDNVVTDWERTRYFERI